MVAHPEAAPLPAAGLSDLRKLFFVCWPLFLGNTLEWYEFATYGYLEKQMGANFFRGSDVATWLGFALTFVTRPLGGWVLGFIGDKFGRRLAVNLSIWGMLAGTVGQGLLPTYLSSGPILGTVGLVLLILLRILQGLCTAGEISSIATYVVEVGPKAELGQAISLIGVTLTVGFLAGLLVVMASTALLGADAMLQWGWRIPFLLAMLPGAVSIWGRRQLPESPLFLEQAEAKEGGPHSVELGHPRDAAGAGDASYATFDPESRAAHHAGGAASAAVAAPGHAADGEALGGHESLMHYWPALVLGIATIMATAMVRYTGMVWCVAYLKSRGLDSADAMWAGVVSNVVQLVLTLPVGWLTDKQGVGLVTLWGALAVALGGLPLFMVFEAHPTSALAAMLGLGLGFGVLSALTSSTCWLFLAELFPTSIRASGVGIALNVGMTIFGGFGPMAAQASLNVLPAAPGVLLSAGGIVTASAVLCGMHLQRRGVLRLTHIRPQPYFGRGAATGRDEPLRAAGAS